MEIEGSGTMQQSTRIQHHGFGIPGVFIQIPGRFACGLGVYTVFGNFRR